jgi:D-alanine transaminase
MIVFINNKFVDEKDAAISPFDRGFLFADGVYESIRSYNGKLFQYKNHIKRLKRSLKEIQINFQQTDNLENIIYELIERNKIRGGAIVYIQITRGATIPRKHQFPSASVNPTLFVSVQNFSANISEKENGIKVILDKDTRWLRCDIKSVSLLPVILSNQKAKASGAEEAILIRDGLITEGTHTNFFAVKKNVVFTAPESDFILSGITRKVVLKLCSNFKIKVKEEFIPKNELKSFNEFFITSTQKEITPVVQIDDWKINNSKPGEITKLLQAEFSKLPR